MWILPLIFVASARAGTLSPDATPMASPSPLLSGAPTARDVMAEILQSPEALAGSAQTDAKIGAAIRAYRFNAVPQTLTLAEAPFVSYVIENEVLPDYGSLMATEYIPTYASEVTNQTLEGLFDLFLGEVIEGTLTGDLKKTGDQIGVCMAQKIEKAKGPSCALDSTDALPKKKPSAIELLTMKLTCGTPLYSGCAVRKAIYDDSKAELVKYSSQWPAIFQGMWPSAFRSSLMAGFNQDQTQIGSIVSTKFGSSYEPSVWNQGALMDLDDTTGRTESLHEFSNGLRDDMRAASILSQSTDPSSKNLAAPLFYAAANRLLVLMGGVGVKWAGSQFVPVTGNAFDPNHPNAAPQYQTSVFGGITATFYAAIGATGEEMAPIDISTYNPNGTPSPTPLQIFPTKFAVGANDVPSRIAGTQAAETLGDLADLMNALDDFMELSGAGSVLAPHFASDASITDIVDPTKPALFPTEGRALAAGLIAAEFQNILSAQGHLQMPPSGGSPTVDPTDPDHSGVFDIKFYDQVGLEGRVLPGKVPTQSLAKLFTAAARFSQLIAEQDPAIPASISSIKSQIDLAVQVGLLSIIASAQGADGGVYPNLGATSGERTLSAQIDVLKAMTLGYQVAQSDALRQAIHSQWVFLDGFWAQNEADLPASLGAGGAAVGQASQLDLWALENLWAQTQASLIYGDLMNPSLDPNWATSEGWAKWQSRFSALENSLQF